MFHFEEFELDRGAYELRKNGRPVQIERIPFELLCLLIERRGRVVAREEIIERIWGKDVFLEVEHSVNTAVRKVRIALEDDPEAPRFVRTVPGRGYRFIAPVSETEADAPDSQGKPSAQSSRRAMLVVLPFENLSSDSDQEYFSDGLTEETITGLGQLGAGRLGVIARTSAMTYKGTRKSIAEIGRELGVDYAVEGSVRRAGDRVRISAQLIRVSDQIHLWAESYDRELKDVLSLQADLGRAIAEQVQIRIAPRDPGVAAQAKSMDEAAYDAYLRGRFHLWRVTRPDLERAIQHFRQATEIDPRMAVAYAGLADCYDVLPITSDARPREAFPKAEQAAMQALKIDHGLAEAHCALASVRFWYNWDWHASEEHSRRAIARNTNYARAHLRYGHMLSNTGRHESAIAEIDMARQLDPFSPIINTLCAQFRFQARRHDAALSLLARTLEIDPNFWVANILAAKIYQFLGRYDEALRAAETASHFSAGNTEATALAGYTYGLMGRRDDAHRVLEELRQRAAERFVPPYNLATVYLGMADYDKVIECLEEAYRERDVHIVFLQVEPKWDCLRQAPPFQSLLRRVSLA
ncbi:MAG TPA: tetratricopeptide repeat protein [Candidatus Cybelea sp.]|nr:tetratricopeptide repeat protein [Candidatus Cybelea sp.]